MKKVELGKYRYRICFIDSARCDIETKMHDVFIVNYLKQHFYLWWVYNV